MWWPVAFSINMRSLILFILSLFSFSFLGQALQYQGADFSSLPKVENAGFVYTDSNSVPGAKLETILYNHGTNLARIRVWTGNTDYSLDYGLALAKRAVVAGMDLMIDLHYSDTCNFLIFFLILFVIKSFT